MTKSRVVFMGTPDFAVPALKALAIHPDLDLVLVVTQPDRPAGRGKKLVAPPVKTAAEELGLNVFQTESLRDQEIKELIIIERPDLIVVAAFGMILGEWILELPAKGCVNLHASLLPQYRGASPISAAILAGDAEAGVTLMQMDRGLDTGDMLATITVPVDANDTTESLTPKLAEAAAVLLDKEIANLIVGKIQPVPQPDNATETRQLTKHDGHVDWSQPAAHIERHVRAMWNWPRAWTELNDGTRMQIHLANVIADDELTSGKIAIRDKAILVGTGDGALELVRIQLPGGKPIQHHAILQRLSPHAGTILT